MSIRGPRCFKHPSHVLLGVCAYCLRERLAGLAGVECASNTHTHHIRKKQQSPSHSLAANGYHKQSLEKRGGNGVRSHVSTHSGVNKGFPGDSIPHVPTTHTHVVIAKGLDKSVVVETVAHDAMQQPTKLSVSRTKAHETISAQIPKPNETRGSDTSISIHPPTILDTARDGCAIAEVPAVQRSLSWANRPLFTHVGGRNLSSDVRMSILENDQHTRTDSKLNMHLQKHTTIGCGSPLICISQHTNLVDQGRYATLSGSERKSFHAVHGARRSLLFPEPTVENVKDEEITLSDASPTFTHKKKTLSSLFSSADADPPSSKSKVKVSKHRSSAKGDALFNGSGNMLSQHILDSNITQTRYKHGSFLERVEPNAYLFPVPESVDGKPFSWFSSLFRWHKKKSQPKSAAALANFSEHNNGWEDARQSWDAPRPSSWEQFRLSSFEGPRSSWEPARPSWEDVMRTSNGIAVFSGLDYVPYSLVDARGNVPPTQRNQQELNTEDPRNGYSDARWSLDSKRLGLKFKPLAPKIPFLDDKDGAHSFLPARATPMQRDVSTQTTPPRSSDATEIFIQQRLQHSRHHCRQHHAKASHAVWSKVWSKTFFNSKWILKQIYFKERHLKELGGALMSLDEAHEQGNLTSGRSSFHEGTNIANNHHPKPTYIHNIEEQEGWVGFHNPMQEGQDAMTRIASKGDTFTPKDVRVDKARGSALAIENGLLKFYLTPVRVYNKNK